MFIRFRLIDRAGKIEAFAKVKSNGSLSLPYAKIYDFTHLVIAFLALFKKNVYERDVVVAVVIAEVLLAFVALSLWMPP